MPCRQRITLPLAVLCISSCLAAFSSRGLRLSLGRLDPDSSDMLFMYRKRPFSRLVPTSAVATTRYYVAFVIFVLPNPQTAYCGRWRLRG